MDYYAYNILRSAAAALAIYSAGHVLYHLFFSPLAKFPGPKIAAATRWYETYYDVVKGGQYEFEIHRMHQKYGPIVRISPYELHIHDPDYYDTIYAGPARIRDRYDYMMRSAVPRSMMSETHHDVHHQRRKTFSPFFSKQAIAGIAPLIQRRVNRLCDHFTRAEETGEALELHACFASLASDIVTEYLFGEAHATRYLDQPTITNEWKRTMNSLFESLAIMRHFPWLIPLAQLYYWTLPYFSPVADLLIQFRKGVRKQVKQLLDSDRQEYDHNAVLLRILDSDKVLPEEKDLSRLADEVIFIRLAGTDAPSQALAISIYHILTNRDVLTTLKREFTLAFPDPASEPTLSQLERLSYFSAVIKETLRLSAVVLVRLPRIAPYETLQYGEWQIPAGTPVGMSIHYILRDPSVFPEPLAFKPERWLQDRHGLDKYFVLFVKGTMNCLGPNMTYAWMYITLYSILRRFELSLFETTEENVAVRRDCYNTQTEKGKNNIRVVVNRTV